MSRKKMDPTEEKEVIEFCLDEVVENEAAEPVEVVKNTPEESPLETPSATAAVTEFMWHNQKRYRCSKCPFDSESESEIYSHYRTRHIVAQGGPRTTAVDTGLLDPSGNKITRLEEVNNGTDSSYPG